MPDASVCLSTHLIINPSLPHAPQPAHHKRFLGEGLRAHHALLPLSLPGLITPHLTAYPTPHAQPGTCAAFVRGPPCTLRAAAAQDALGQAGIIPRLLELCQCDYPRTANQAAQVRGHAAGVPRLCSSNHTRAADQAAQVRGQAAGVPRLCTSNHMRAANRAAQVRGQAAGVPRLCSSNCTRAADQPAQVG